MALPEFVNDANNLQSGTTNKLAAGLAKIKSAEGLMKDSTASVGDSLATLDPSNLPNLPLISDLNNAGDVAHGLVNIKLAELDEVDNLAGTCLGGAMGSLKSIINNGFGMVEDIMSSVFGSVDDMPSAMNEIQNAFGKAQQGIASLGIDKIVSDIMSHLGCIEDSSMISDVQAELDASMAELGLNSEGIPDDEVMYNKMKSDLAEHANELGIDTSFTDSMSDGLGVMTAKSNELSALSASTANAKMDGIKQSVKDSVPKVPTPPSFF